MRISDQTSLNVFTLAIGPGEIVIGLGVLTNGEPKAAPCKSSLVFGSLTSGKIGAHILPAGVSAPRIIFRPFLSISLLLVLIRQRVAVQRTALCSPAHIAVNATRTNFGLVRYL